ncbi:MULTISPECIES: VOC family protein [unclassified Streptomyces]|uniref:VOC family protein n=1 Tax=unclassified Streptomyces TaxID=2593676 RepID=UPI001CC037DF|nr:MULTISPECIES: VOC family protein [unclassified Streptomyces]WPO75317.1 VOC family protein [Streptomyces sp. KN37]
MSSIKQFQVTFDCAEPERVARFWCEVPGYVVSPPPKGFATWEDFDRSRPPEEQGAWFACGDPSGVGPRLFFQRVPEGKAVKNRVHLDVRVSSMSCITMQGSCSSASSRTRATSSVSTEFSGTSGDGVTNLDY